MADASKVPVDTEASYSDELFEMYCESCNREGTHVTAVSFCTTCMDYFCSTCAKYHRKFLPDHKYLDIDNMPQDTCLEKCLTHKDEIVKFYCVSCNTVACSICKTESHKNVGQLGSCDLKYLPEVVKDFDIETELKKLHATSDKIAKTISDTRSTIHAKMRKSMDIQEKGKVVMQTETEAVLKRYFQELHSLEERAESEKTSHDARLGAAVANYDNIKSEIDQLSIHLEHLPVSQKTLKHKLLTNVTQLSKDLKSAETALKTFISDFSSKSDAFESEVRARVDRVTERVKTFGTLLWKTYEIERDKTDEEVQRKTASLMTTIDVEHYSDEEACCIVDCCLLSPKYLVLCDENNSCLKLVNVEDQELVSKRIVKAYPKAVTKITTSEIAMTQPNEHDYDESVIEFLTVTSTKSLYFQKRCIRTDMFCEDILYNDDKLIIALSGNGNSKIQILDMDGEVLGTVDEDSGCKALFSSPLTLALDRTAHSGGRLYVADSYNDRLTEIHYEIKDDDYEWRWTSVQATINVRKIFNKFYHPEALTTDTSGYIYVLDGGTRRVHAFHPRRSNSEVQLIDDDTEDPWQPKSICYCNTNNVLYVGQVRQNCIKVFKVKEITFKKNQSVEKVVRWLPK